MNNIFVKLKSISIEEQKSLLLKFKELTTVSDVFKFWEDNFGLDYYTGAKSYCAQDFNWIIDFLVYPKEKSQIRAYNEYFIERTRLEMSDSFLSYEKLTTEFENKFKEVTNKKEFIKKELTSVTTCSTIKAYTNSFKSSFDTAYENYLLYSKEPDIEKITLPIHEIIALENGCTWAKYKLFLEDKLTPASAKKKTKSKIELTTRQKLLLCKELGILKIFNADKELSDLANADKALLLSYLFGNDGTENIRKDLSDLSKIETSENIALIETIFTDLGLDNKVVALSFKK